MSQNKSGIPNYGYKSQGGENVKAKLTVNVGGMFSGKSTELLQQGERHLIRKDNVLFIKPRIDSRYSNEEIVTHSGKKVSAMVVDENERFDYLFTNDVDVVLIDEAQFFNEEIIISIKNLLLRGITVYCSGLDMDYTGKPYGYIPQLMAMADNVNKLHAICEDCGDDATFTFRKVSNENRTLLGSNLEYKPLCRTCYNNLKVKENEKGFY